MTIIPADRQSLLILARSTIETKLGIRTAVQRPQPVPAALQAKRGCFVTLHKSVALRGCIGTIAPLKSLIRGVEDNVLNAAFRDPRFKPLDADEAAGVDIEISVLSVPAALSFEDGDDLKSKLKPGEHGVILSRGGRSATFLPQVWSQLPNKEIFLKHLCLKGGMNSNCWQDPTTVVKVYEAEYFSE